MTKFVSNTLLKWYKKKKFATTLLTTALLTCGFTLETDAEPQAEVQAPTGVCVTTTETEQQDLVSSKSNKRKTGHPSPRKATVSPSELPEEQTQDPFNESGKQPSTSQSQDQAPQKSGKRHIKTGQPSHENAPMSHGKPPREQPSPLQEETNTAE